MIRFAKGTIAGILVLGILGFVAFRYYASPSRGLPYRPSLTSSALNWTTFGGAWQIAGGSMRNDSDERGAKLLMGSRFWRNYTVDADVQLLGLGDAGIIARVTHPELGVDSYSGYYAGLRTMDGSLVLGRADYGWQEYPPVAMPGGVQPFHWYHLTLSVYGCRIAAVAVDRATGKQARVVFRPRPCTPTGRIGLRSYTSGGIWRNIRVTPLTSAALPRPQLLGHLAAPEGSSHQRSLLAAYVSGNAAAALLHKDLSHAQSIGSLRYLSPVHPSRAVVRGVVVLTSPRLYVQDNTGGIAVEPRSSPSLKIGDEVEVSGEIEPRPFRSVLTAASVHLLWESSPDPPLSITANQAATGAYDGMFIQTEGRLKGEPVRQGNMISLDLVRQEQEFHAVLDAGRSTGRLLGIYSGSTLRLRGICVSDPHWTKSLTPFVLLVRSAGDIKVLVGPPWWSWSTLLPFVLAALVLIGIGYHLFLLARHWRLRAILEERSRLAHEIHDTLAQSFAGISFQLQAIRTSMPPNMPVLNEQVRVACDLVRHSHEEARRGIASLRPESPESADLLAALEASAVRMTRSGEIALRVSREGNAPALPLRMQDTLFRIGQEAIANAVQHSGAAHIRISTRYEGSALHLLIEDDGCGFDADLPHGGFGLVGMRERARSIGAGLAVVSSKGSGARIEATVPLPVSFSLKNCYRWLWNVCRTRTRAHSYSYR
ncbi:MAG TPA: histidine kinase [Bryobacteraceae bacterium]